MDGWHSPPDILSLIQRKYESGSAAQLTFRAVGKTWGKQDDNNNHRQTNKEKQPKEPVRGCEKGYHLLTAPLTLTSQDS